MPRSALRLLLPLALACLASWQVVSAAPVLAPAAQLDTDTPVPTDTPTETATPTITPTPTETPTPAATPCCEYVVTLDSGHGLLIQRSWSFGEIAIVLAILAQSAIYGLHWIYEMAKREVR